MLRHARLLGVVLGVVVATLTLSVMAGGEFREPAAGTTDADGAFAVRETRIEEPAARVANGGDRRASERAKPQRLLLALAGALAALPVLSGRPAAARIPGRSASMSRWSPVSGRAPPSVPLLIV